MSDPQAVTPQVPPPPPPIPQQPRLQPGQTPPPVRKARLSGCWMIFLGMLLVFIVGSLWLGSAVKSGLSEMTEKSELKTQYVEGQGQDQIALIPVTGVIGGQPEAVGGANSMIAKVTEQLRRAVADHHVKAIVLEIDSPGGGVTASDVLYQEILEAQKSGKKIVVHMSDVCASGGYYISAPADTIIASPTTITGSIGVIMHLMNASELLEKKLGIKLDTVQSGDHKDIMSMSRPLTAEERKILQDLVNEMYERFVGIVVQGRKGKGKIPADVSGATDYIKKLADGRIFSGAEAVKNGLADKTGYLSDAFAEARRLTGLNQATVVRYVRNFGIFEALMGASVNLNLGLQLNAGDLRKELLPGLEYRWAPGE